MALPAFREDGWLPIGHFTATWDEVAQRFGDEIGSQRANVLAELLSWRDASLAAGLAGTVIIDGSFISRKKKPGDFDIMFLYDAATEITLRDNQEARVLTDYQLCRIRYGGDVFALPASLRNFAPIFFGTDMFDFDRQGNRKGVVEVIL